MTRPPKKSETLEIRLPYDAKRAFMARCQARGATASDVMRSFIDTELGQVRPRRGRLWQAAAAAAAGLAVGAVAAPSLAQSRPADRATFDGMDANRDGVVTFAEFGR